MKKSTTRTFDPAHSTFNKRFCMAEAGVECHCWQCRLWAETHTGEEKKSDNEFQGATLWF